MPELLKTPKKVSSQKWSIMWMGLAVVIVCATIVNITVADIEIIREYNSLAREGLVLFLGIKLGQRLGEKAANGNGNRNGGGA